MRIGRQDLLGDAGDDRGLGQQGRARRLDLAARSVDAAGRILDRHHLRPARLHILLDPAEAGEQIGNLAGEEMVAVELGRDLDREVQPRPRLLHRLGLGHRTQEIAAERDERLDRSVDHAAAALDRIEPLLARRLEAILLLESVDRHQFGLLGDADGALALDVAVPAHRGRARPGLADIPAHQQQVHQHADIVDAMDMLGQPHAIDRHHRLGPGIDPRRGFELAFGQAAFALDRGPGRCLHRREEILEARRVGVDEGGIQHARLARCDRRVMPFDQELGDAHHRGDVAAGAHLVILGRDRGFPESRHLDRVLRIGEAFEPALLQRIEGHDLHPALATGAQVMEHARRVRSDILAEEEDRVAMLEILEPGRADRHADRRLEPDRGRFMAHVGTVGQVLVAVHPRHQPIHVGRFQAGAARRIEDHRFGIERLQRGADADEGVVPRHRLICVGGGIVAQRIGQSAMLLQIVIVPGAQFGECMLREEFGRGAQRRQLPRGRLGAFLAEFGGMLMFGAAPGAAHAGETVGLVLALELAQHDWRDALARQDLGQ